LQICRIKRLCLSRAGLSKRGGSHLDPRPCSLQHSPGKLVDEWVARDFRYGMISSRVKRNICLGSHFNPPPLPVCFILPNHGLLVTEWVVGTPRCCMPSKAQWQNSLDDRIKRNVCLGSDYRMGMGHISTHCYVPYGLALEGW
jgi:hypothetical protein